ncbi:MAG: DUF192 domain-containing protein [Actinomycetota bacterium]
MTSDRGAHAWLVAQGRVLASATVAESRTDRRRGLIGQNDPQFALVLPHCKWIHTFGVRCVLDVAYLDDKSQVVKLQRVAPMRLPLPVRDAHTVVEAKAGSFERWGLRVGDVVEVRRT